MDNARKIDKLKTLQVRIDDSNKVLKHLIKFNKPPYDKAVVVDIDAGDGFRHRLSASLLIDLITNQIDEDKIEYQTILSELYNQTGGN